MTDFMNIEIRVNVLERGYRQSGDFDEFGEIDEFCDILPKIEVRAKFGRYPSLELIRSNLDLWEISSNSPNSLRYGFYSNCYGEISSNLPFSLLRAKFLDVSAF